MTQDTRYLENGPCGSLELTFSNIALFTGIPAHYP